MMKKWESAIAKKWYVKNRAKAIKSALDWYYKNRKRILIIKKIYYTKLPAYYKTLKNIKQRCNNPHNPKYHLIINL